MKLGKLNSNFMESDVSDDICNCLISSIAAILIFIERVWRAAK